MITDLTPTRELKAWVSCRQNPTVRPLETWKQISSIETCGNSPILKLSIATIHFISLFFYFCNDIATIFFFFFLSPFILAMSLPQFIFFALLLFRQSHCHNHFFSLFLPSHHFSLLSFTFSHNYGKYRCWNSHFFFSFL